MFKRFARWTALAVLVGIATGCGGDGDRALGPDPEIAGKALTAASKAAVRPQATVTATVTNGGSPSPGVLLRFGRSVAGRLVDYAWSGTTGSDGTATVEIVVPPLGPFGRLGAGGYYQAQAVDPTSGAVMARWNSIPIRAGVENELTLPMGGPARLVDTHALGGPTLFTVRIENIGEAYSLAASGAFNTPVGASAPGALTPGGAYEFEVQAPPGHNLSFATMFVHSNDFFFAPDESGIALWDENGDPITGDITDRVMLWDSGTEVDQEPGTGADQAPRQSGPNAGAADSDATVRLASDSFNNLPAVEDVIQVTATSLGDGMFRIRIENVSTATTLSTTAGDVAVPLAPGVYAVHSSPGALFSVGEEDSGDGLEALAEDGDLSGLAAALGERTGLTAPLAPGVWAIAASGEPLFTVGATDRGEGLEALAEDGSPSELGSSLVANSSLASNGVFTTPEGSSGPGPLLPGNAYVFSFSAEPGDRLSFATMFVPSNDFFFAPAAGGVALWSHGGLPVSGDITGMIQLWDAGTEADELPGFGSNQAPFQSGPNTGDADSDATVRSAASSLPAVGDLIRVTVTPGS